MNLLKNKGYLKVGLIVVAASIWLHNGYRFFKGVKQADEPTKFRLEASDTKLPESADRPLLHEWTDEAKHRDPFKNWLVIAKPKPPRRKPARVERKKPVQVPAIRLLGLIEDRNGRLAVLENANRQTAFAGPGDEFDGIKILTVDSIEVSCEYEENKFVLRLP